MCSKWLSRFFMVFVVCVVSTGSGLSQSASVDLATSKQILEPVPGSPQPLNSLPMAVAWSPDHRHLAVINAGYGTFESKYDQSIAVLDTVTGKITDVPDERTGNGAHQTMYAGLAFSLDGKHLYASFDSLSAPEGNGKEDTGNAIAVFAVAEGAITAEKLIPVPLQVLEKGRTQNQLGKRIPDGQAIPAPAGLAVVRGRDGSEQILVADNFSDDALLLDAATGKVIHRFDMAETTVVPAMYPIAVAVSRDNEHAFVALWNGSALAELNLRTGKVVDKLALLPPEEKTSPSSHPAALAMSPDEKTLFVALANRDSVAAVRLNGPRMQLAGLFDTRLPGQTYFGAMPDAVAVSDDDARLYAANTGSNVVAVFALGENLGRKMARPLGFIPTEWYPTALAVKENKLYIVTGKGQGTKANVAPQPIVTGSAPRRARPHTYIATMLHGSLAAVDRAEAERDLKRLTAEVITSNRMDAAEQHLPFHAGTNPIHHVIYIIKENRTYDQVFGDLGVGDGDASLTMYGRNITPNLHRLAEQFGVLDRFYDSGEVSGNGHVWSTAGITSDYTEKTWQQSYRGRERPYDYEGVVEEGYPLQEGIPDVDEPGSSYLWTNLAKHGRTLYHFGEFVSSKFCDDSGEAPKDKSQLAGTPEPPTGHCQRSAINKGEQIPDNYGGGASPYPWKIPLIFQNVATKPELQGHFDPVYPDFNLSFPDQLRVEEFLTHFRAWQKDLQNGHDTMPEFVMLRLPNDHTAGTKPGMPRPEASVADNDLAVGRAVDAVSHSGFWGSTAFFVLEDDAQDGADHVDAHRSIALVVSKYSPRRPEPVVDHNFYTTVSVIRTMEDLLRIPPMNNNDAFAPLIAPLFAGEGDQPAFAADYRNRDSGLIYESNSPKAPGARESSKMDFSHADRADAQALNVILWRDAMGDRPIPKMVLHPHGSRKSTDDDD
jgi:DNA-binding beta-propeller fold protein YncE